MQTVVYRAVAMRNNPLPLPLGEVPQIFDLGRRGLFVLPSQSKIKDFCQLSLRESQEWLHRYLPYKSQFVHKKCKIRRGGPADFATRKEEEMKKMKFSIFIVRPKYE